jgi:hypothetical protein
MIPRADPSISAAAQIAASSQQTAEPRETACGSSSKSSISWGIIDENRQDGV